MIRLRVQTTAVMTALLLLGCRLGQVYERPEDLQNQPYRSEVEAGVSIANMPWWELFGDQVLIQLIESGIENNLDLKTAYVRINEAEAQLGVVRANLYPRINYGGDGSLSDSTIEGAEFSSSANAFTTVSYQVDLWGRFRNLSDAALNEYLATEEAYRSLTLIIVSNVAQAYLLLRDLDNRLYIAERTAETWKDNLDIVKARFKAGIISEVDLRQSEIQVEEALTTIQTFTRLRVQTENAISILIGSPPMDIERGLALQDQVFPPELPVGIPSELLDRRPDILAAERRLEAQTYRVGAAEALQYPSLNLNADLGAVFANSTSLFYNLGAQVFGPIFNNQENKRQLEIERARSEQLLFTYKNTFLNALKEVEDARIAVETYKKEFEARSRQVTAASKALELSWVRYESGVTSYLEILDLQRSQFTSLLNASETLQLQLTSSVQLYQALGGGWQIASQAEDQ